MKSVVDIVQENHLIHTDNNDVKVYASMEDPDAPPGHDYVVAIPSEDDVVCQLIGFQNGAVKIHGVNGITTESLLAINIHRIETLNELFPCQENETAIEHMKAALEALEACTRDRIVRQVEGENKV